MRKKRGEKERKKGDKYRTRGECLGVQTLFNCFGTRENICSGNN
jgi:hypothetical protein